MSTVTKATEEQPDARSTASAAVGDQTRHRVALLVAFAITAWAVVEFIDLGVKHTTGPEIYGVLTAALTIGAGIAGVVLLRSARPHAIPTLAVLALWGVIAMAGIAGTVAHVVGPVPGHGPVDVRPRPVAAPLIFTLFAVVGGGALVVGKRPRIGRVLGSGEE
jgi:peptidoglycan/LPS O-acetylase OafA/YrhL